MWEEQTWSWILIEVVLSNTALYQMIQSFLEFPLDYV